MQRATCLRLAHGCNATCTATSARPHGCFTMLHSAAPCCMALQPKLCAAMQLLAAIGFVRFEHWGCATALTSHRWRSPAKREAEASARVATAAPHVATARNLPRHWPGTGTARYGDAVYHCLVTATTVGYGDLFILSDSGDPTYSRPSWPGPTWAAIPRSSDAAPSLVCLRAIGSQAHCPCRSGADCVIFPSRS